MRPLNILFIVLIGVALACPLPAQADYILTRHVDVTKEARKELKRLLKEGKREDWEKILAPEFMNGFGGDDPARMKDDFLKHIMEDQAYRDEFSQILGMRCARYHEDTWACPAKWVNCPEGDYFCGTQTRILVDIRKKDWRLSFYGKGD